MKTYGIKVQLHLFFISALVMGGLIGQVRLGKVNTPHA